MVTHAYLEGRRRLGRGILVPAKERRSINEEADFPKPTSTREAGSG
jgi:hypothetical protein